MARVPKVGKEAEVKKNRMWVEGLSCLYPLQPWANQGEEEEENEEVASGLSEALGRETRVLDWPPFERS